jgi:nucleoside-diphosphate-sugar epimerase
VCDLFLRDGGYSVKGTVRDKNNQKKLAPLQKAFGERFLQLELAEADLLKPETLDAAIQGAHFVVHTASPFPLTTPKDENILIKPAVEGTLAVMRAAHKHKVKRVVITSSVASVYAQKPENRKAVYNESDWSDLEACVAYEKSKTLAEKAAWDYLEKLPQEEKFELVTINPSLILGPSLIDGDFSSGQVISMILLNKYPGLPKIMFSVVDVRDVALAHLNALKLPSDKAN